MLEIQKLLLSNPTDMVFSHLKEALHIHIKESATDSRVLFKYDQIDSPMGNLICQECRGIILDRNDNWSVVSFPFRKFFNYNEGHAARIDLSSAFVLEKVDGTCITLYYFQGKWRIQTLGMMDAEGEMWINGTERISFADLFKQTIGCKDPDGFKNLDTEYTYTFELATKHNRIVTRYEKDRVVLLSIRDIRTLRELPYGSIPFCVMYSRIFADFPIVDLPKRYLIDDSSIDNIARMAAKLPQLDEGYVVMDMDCNRVKVKNPSYLAIQRLKDKTTASPTALIQLALANEGSEFLVYFPEFTEEYNKIYQCIQCVKEKLIQTWEINKEISDQKEFALKIKASNVPFTDILFKLKKGMVADLADEFTKIDAKRMLDGIRKDIK